MIPSIHAQSRHISTGSYFISPDQHPQIDLQLSPVDVSTKPDRGVFQIGQILRAWRDSNHFAHSIHLKLPSSLSRGWCHNYTRRSDVVSNTTWNTRHIMIHEHFIYGYSPTLPPLPSQPDQRLPDFSTHLKDQQLNTVFHHDQNKLQRYDAQNASRKPRR